MKKCKYCGMSNQSSWLYCGESKSWGCGAPLPKGAPITWKPSIKTTLRSNMPADKFTQSAIDDLKTQLGKEFIKVLKPVVTSATRIIR